MCKDLELKRNDYLTIKQFKLKENITIDELIKDGFFFFFYCKYLSKIIPLDQTILAWIKVSLKDYSLSIDVIDDDYCQYYTPFYEYQEGNNKVFDFLAKVINRYNYELSKSNVIIEEA